MLIWSGAGTIVAIAIAWLASLVHSSGHAPFGLISIAVGIALGASLWKLAGMQRPPIASRRLVISTILLSLVTIMSEHTWLYLDFRRQWAAAREKSPQVAIFRPESPWSFREFVADEADCKQITIWSIDAILILSSAVITAVALTRCLPNSSGFPICEATSNDYPHKQTDN